MTVVVEIVRLEIESSHVITLKARHNICLDPKCRAKPKKRQSESYGCEIQSKNGVLIASRLYRWDASPGITIGKRHSFS
jgi:hypothetical protein